MPVGENLLSRLVAFLLDPHATHGQGEAFLDLFLTAMGWKGTRDGLSRAVVRTEAPTSRIDAYRRRLDIVATFRGGVIAIENKPWAADQVGQVRDYLDHLRRQNGDRHCLVYLTQGGAAPSEASLDRSDRQQRLDDGGLVEMPYGQLADWLTQCHAVCRAAKVAYFIRDLERYVRSDVLGEVAMSDDRDLVDLLTSSRSNLEAALRVGSAVGSLKDRLLGCALLAVKRQAGAVFPLESVGHDIHEAGKPGIRIRLSAGEYACCFEFANSRYERPYFGLWQSGLAACTDHLGEVFDKEFGRGRRDVRWPWWQHPDPASALISLPTDWLTNPEGWLLLQEGDAFAERFVALAKRMDALVGASP